MKRNLGLCLVTEKGSRFETGRPVSFKFRRGTTPSPKFGPRFGQDIEPTGRYMVLDPGGPVPKGFEAGKVSFKNPLVLKLVNSKDPDAAIYGPAGWKARLRKAYRKKGRALSCALRKEGYDGIVTCDVVRGEAGTSEIIDLRKVPCK